MYIWSSTVWKLNGLNSANNLYFGIARPETSAQEVLRTRRINININNVAVTIFVIIIPITIILIIIITVSTNTGAN